MADLSIDVAREPLGEPWPSMTFPFYRPLLPLLGAGGIARDGHDPFACTAIEGGVPRGLALAQRLPSTPAAAEVVSLFVAPEARGRGIATRLLERLETAAADLGIREINGTYLSGRPSLDALQRVLEKRGFEPPLLRMVAFKFTTEQAEQCRWYQRARMPAGASIFKWRDVTDEDIARLKQSQAATGWIDEKLLPWTVNPDWDRVSSVGMRQDGDIVGWVVNHRLSPEVVTFSISFIRPDLARRGGIFPLYVASLESLRGTGVLCSFVTNAVDFPDMTRFMLRHGTPFAEYAGQTYGVRKLLVDPAVR